MREMSDTCQAENPSQQHRLPAGAPKCSTVHTITAALCHESYHKEQ
jgi:hypothetical protein